MNYYNENDQFAAEWLRQLIKAGHIADGFVDERSILDVAPEDLKRFTQCHFFAGIGVWSYALRQCGWPDDKPVWTGSCPCQPFSNAGAGKGTTDERHLWPAFYHLISQSDTPVVFGEQVASKSGREWLDVVQTDMETLGFAFGAADLCAASVGSPNIRQRLYFVSERLGDSIVTGLEGYTGHENPVNQQGRNSQKQNRPAAEAGSSSRLANSNSSGSQQGCERPEATRQRNPAYTESSPGWMGNAEVCPQRTLDGEQKQGNESQKQNRGYGFFSGRSNTDQADSFWRAVDWLSCRDGKWRPVEPESFPLADGVTNRVGKLRGYGNAINAEVAKAFIKSYLETTTPEL